MKTLTLTAGQISEIIEVGPGTRITSTGNGTIEWTPGYYVDALNSPDWQTWGKGSSAGSADTLRRLCIRATATGSMTVTIEEGKHDVDPDGAYWDDELVYTQTNADGSVSLVGAGGTYQSFLLPTGNDQASEIEQYINDTAGNTAAVLGGGDFIIGSPLTLYSRHNYGAKWGSKGIGLGLKAAGAENTRILYTGSKASPCFLITDPGSTDPEISNRNTFGEFSGFSLLSAQSDGTENPALTVNGSAIEARGTTSDVLHGMRFKDLRLDGWQYGISLDNATGASFERCWFQEFEAAIRLGYNSDVIKVAECMFGLEQFSSGNERNSAIAIKTGWDTSAWDGGNGNNILLMLNLFMAIGVGIDIGATENQIYIFNNYFERVQRYYKTTAGSIGALVWDGNTFSQPNVNDSAEAKIHLGTAGNTRIEFKNNLAPSGTPTESWIKFQGFNTSIKWSKNYLLGPHIEYTDGTNTRTLTLPNSGTGEHSFGGVYGIARTSGDEATQTLATTGAITVNWYDADIFDIPAMTGNITLYMPASATPPPVGIRKKFRIRAGATSPETKAVTFDTSTPYFKFGYTFAQPGASDANKITTVEVERSTNGHWIVVSPQNVWL